MLITTSGVPRIAPTTIQRARLQRWLTAHSETPVRLIIAPAGSGKTSVLLKHAVDSPREVAYCAMGRGYNVEDLRCAIARALGVQTVPESYEALLAMLAWLEDRPLELIIDDAGDGDCEAVTELHRLVEDVGENVALIYAARSLDRINARRLVARGVAEVCDARRLAFDEEEARLLAEACGVEYTDRELKRLVADTDGWALAFCAATRTAAAEKEKLSAAYEHWLSESSPFLHDFIDAELDRIPDDEAQLFRDVLAGSASAEPSELRALQAHGLFIIDEGDDVLRPYHPLQRKGFKGQRRPARQTQSAPLLSVKMLGTFEAKIDGREIQWARRRDQQIVKYLLLKPDGSATRTELMASFWSGTDHHLATQSMRTAFSTIRRAIAAVVGYDQVEYYFRTAPGVQLVLNHIVCDARRFSTHVSNAEAYFERNELKEAAFHYRAADKLYAGSLLEYDAPESWFAVHARSLQERHLLVLERLADICLETGDRPAARQYTLRAAAISPEQPSVAKLLERTRDSLPMRSNGAEIESVTRTTQALAGSVT